MIASLVRRVLRSRGKRSEDADESDPWRLPVPGPDWNPVIGHCPQCGLELRTAMWYSCSRPDCRVFKHPTL